MFITCPQNYKWMVELFQWINRIVSWLWAFMWLLGTEFRTSACYSQPCSLWLTPLTPISSACSVPTHSSPKMYYYYNHIFCIHSSADRHLGSFQLLVISNKGAMNIVEHVSWCMVEHLLDISLEAVWLVLQVELFPVFWGTTRLISRVIVQVSNSTSKGLVLLFLYILASICCHLNFWS